MSKIDEFINTLGNELINYAKENWQQYEKQAVKDGNEFLNKLKADLAVWSKQVADGELSEDELAWLIEGKKDLAQLESLKQAGLAQVNIDKFMSGLINIIISNLFKTFL
ncbi:hypothetical protein [Dickeya zeae]|uniref:Uncharacterized protein n=1 Tax=Dickeya zeae TaxID=204042 RepID=A0ABX8VY68_9GAMM|nr:hypothetical protein [Dickeya zeae]QYM92208.1 hypothetical protein FGI21_10130 [Dickeya zeae]